MDEEKEKKPEEPKPAENTGEGSEPKTTEPIDNANKAAERMERANKKKEELLDREEALLVQARLSGRSLAGGEKPKEETEDEKWTREAKERYAGTGMDPTE